MYFDPGTGSMLIQILLGSIPVAAAFFIGLRKKLFRRKGDDAPTVSAPPRADANDGFEDIDDD